MESAQEMRDGLRGQVNRLHLVVSTLQFERDTVKQLLEEHARAFQAELEVWRSLPLAKFETASNFGLFQRRAHLKPIVQAMFLALVPNTHMGTCDEARRV